MMFSPPPRSLRAVAKGMLAGQDPVHAVKEWVDGLIWDVQAASGRRSDGAWPFLRSAYSDEPPLVAKAWRNALHAGYAKHLAALAGEQALAWAEKPEFFLPKPFCSVSEHRRLR